MENNIKKGIEDEKNKHKIIFDIINKKCRNMFIRYDYSEMDDLYNVCDMRLYTTDRTTCVAIRLRKPDITYRDFTIRKTELPKIINGKGNLYFYGWCDEDMNIIEYVLIRLDKFRLYLKDNGIGSTTMNTDGKTCFYNYNLNEINRYGCILEYKKLFNLWLNMNDNGIGWKPSIPNDFFSLDD